MTRKDEQKMEGQIGELMKKLEAGTEFYRKMVRGLCTQFLPDILEKEGLLDNFRTDFDDYQSGRKGDLGRMEAMAGKYNFILEPGETDPLAIVIGNVLYGLYRIVTPSVVFDMDEPAVAPRLVDELRTQVHKIFDEAVGRKGIVWYPEIAIKMEDYRITVYMYSYAAAPMRVVDVKTPGKKPGRMLKPGDSR